MAEEKDPDFLDEIYKPKKHETEESEMLQVLRTLANTDPHYVKGYD
jgi:hypothetical protein|tara:strand:- start:1215 stop:1352 length:138 start_codon:yes stop_codon:yes gene_type:complete